MSKVGVVLLMSALIVMTGCAKAPQEIDVKKNAVEVVQVYPCVCK